MNGGVRPAPGALLSPADPVARYSENPDPDSPGGDRAAVSSGTAAESPIAASTSRIAAGSWIAVSSRRRRPEADADADADADTAEAIDFLAC